MASERLKDAGALLYAGRYAGAYYVSGYVVECALKACIAAKTRQDEFPPKDAARYYIHDLPKLLAIAGLEQEFTEEATNDPEFRENWSFVKDWSEEARCESRDENQAREILRAIGNDQNGVFQWLKRSW